MENVIDIRTALEQLGEKWNFGGSVTDGTEEAWASIDWEDSRVKPSWGELTSAYTDFLIQTQLDDINKKYDAIFSNLSSAFSVAYIVDGADLDNNISLLRAKWAEASSKRELEINAIFGG